MISRMEWAAGRKLRANAGETLTEVLISVLVIALGMTLFLSAFLASGRMLQQGEEQMAGYYDSRNQLERITVSTKKILKHITASIRTKYCRHIKQM